MLQDDIRGVGVPAEPVGAHTVASYFDTFGPGPAWAELVRWPPDVFALANLVLDHTGGYRFVVDPPGGRHWPPVQNWDDHVIAAARAWRGGSNGGGGRLPALVQELWERVTSERETPLTRIGDGVAWRLGEALLTLHAIADEACAGVTARGREAGTAFEGRAWALLQRHGSLSRLSPSRIRVLPKTHLSQRGITIRSLSRYLALCYEAVDVVWRGVDEDTTTRGECDVVLFPWPLTIRPADFRPATSRAIENIDEERFGFFEFTPARDLDLDLVDALLANALEHTERVEAVIFPEDAVHVEELDQLERVVDGRSVPLLIAGVRQPSGGPEFGRNYLHFGVRTAGGWQRFDQDKHHRWCLDETQIRQYHLGGALDPTKLWWEAIGIHERRLHVIDVGGGITTAPLVCEDLASLDEVADLIRRVGPSLVIAVLLDGPQLAARWPCRYGSLLVSDPGSAVLALTALGMAALSRPPRRPRSRVVAHWNSCKDGLHEIELAPGAAAIMLTTRPSAQRRWTADGRCHSDVPQLELVAVQQLAGERLRARDGRTGGAGT